MKNVLKNGKLFQRKNNKSKRENASAFLLVFVVRKNVGNIGNMLEWKYSRYLAERMNEYGNAS